MKKKIAKLIVEFLAVFGAVDIIVRIIVIIS